VLILAVGLVSLFGAVVIGLISLASYSRQRQQLARTLQTGTVSTGTIDVRRDQLSEPVWSRAVLPGLRAAGRFGRRYTPVDVYKRLEQDLIYAGNPPNWDVERILAVKLVLPFVGFGLGLLLWQALDLQGMLGIGMVGLLTAGGYYAPEWVLRSAVDKRQTAIRRTLPDSLDLLSITVEAGLSFDAALVRVAQNIKGPLGQELYRVVQEIQLGKSRSDALRDLAERTNVEALKTFILAMVQADAFGIPIARVLHVQAAEIRLKRRQLAEEQAQKLPVKIVFPLILGIFPAIFVVLLGPAAIQIYEGLIAR
jgi:tight adherence protein C